MQTITVQRSLHPQGKRGRRADRLRDQRLRLLSGGSYGFSDPAWFYQRTNPGDPQGRAEDSRLNAIVGLAASISQNKGHAEDSVPEAFYAAGFDEGALMELIGLITVRVYTNYAFAVTQIPIDFPLADPIDAGRG
jgi:alkylhydroperoxidase family enzyme